MRCAAWLLLTALMCQQVPSGATSFQVGEFVPASRRAQVHGVRLDLRHALVCLLWFLRCGNMIAESGGEASPTVCKFSHVQFSSRGCTGCRVQQLLHENYRSFAEGTCVPLLQKRTHWQDLLGRNCPHFGEQTVVSLHPT